MSSQCMYSRTCGHRQAREGVKPNLTTTHHHHDKPVTELQHHQHKQSVDTTTKCATASFSHRVALGAAVPKDCPRATREESIILVLPARGNTKAGGNEAVCAIDSRRAKRRTAAGTDGETLRLREEPVIPVSSCGRTRGPSNLTAVCSSQ